MARDPDAGWYPDPHDGSRQRWWDGTRWTERTELAALPAGESRVAEGPPSASEANLAMLAHLSALAALLVAMAFLGPLFVLLLRPQDPFVRRHAVEALNFQLTVLLFGVLLGMGALLLVVLTLGIALMVVVPVAAVLVIGWVVLVVHAASVARAGGDYRYPFTVRFVR